MGSSVSVISFTFSLGVAKTKNKIIEFLKGKEKNGKIMSKEYIIKTVILWDVNIF